MSLLEVKELCQIIEICITHGKEISVEEKFMVEGKNASDNIDYSIIIPVYYNEGCLNPIINSIYEDVIVTKIPI